MKSQNAPGEAHPPVADSSATDMITEALGQMLGAAAPERPEAKDAVGNQIVDVIEQVATLSPGINNLAIRVAAADMTTPRAVASILRSHSLLISAMPTYKGSNSAAELAAENIRKTARKYVQATSNGDADGATASVITLGQLADSFSSLALKDGLRFDVRAIQAVADSFGAFTDPRDESALNESGMRLGRAIRMVARANVGLEGIHAGKTVAHVLAPIADFVQLSSARSNEIEEDSDHDEA